MSLVQKRPKQGPRAGSHHNADGYAPRQFSSRPTQLRIVGHRLDHDTEGVHPKAGGCELIDESGRDDPPTVEGPSSHGLAGNAFYGISGEESLALGYWLGGRGHGLPSE